MDRSFLSDQTVVRASREFICLRLVTYEDEAEMKFMEEVLFIRTAPKNSTFAILDPLGTDHLVEPGRSMRMAFDDAAEMAARMQEISAEYSESKPSTPARLGLPYLKDVRVAMNVAACDSQRLLVLYAKTKSEQKKLEALLLPMAWQEGIMGKLLFATTSEIKDLASIEEHSTAPGLLVIDPDPYGLEGRQVTFIALGTKPKQASKALLEAAANNKTGSKDSKSHIMLGRRKGVHWEALLEGEESPKTRRR